MLPLWRVEQKVFLKQGGGTRLGRRGREPKPAPRRRPPAPRAALAARYRKAPPLSPNSRTSTRCPRSRRALASRSTTTPRLGKRAVGCILVTNRIFIFVHMTKFHSAIAGAT